MTKDVKVGLNGMCKVSSIEQVKPSVEKRQYELKCYTGVMRLADSDEVMETCYQICCSLVCGPGLELNAYQAGPQ